jgi:acetyl-CoA synthetase (ADP-forming)
MFGLGGVWVEALGDVALGVAPLTRYDAAEMLQEIKGAALLSGLRGEEPVDLEALTELIVKLSQLALACPEIAEMDLNPVFVYPQGLKAADALAVMGK